MSETRFPPPTRPSLTPALAFQSIMHVPRHACQHLVSLQWHWQSNPWETTLDSSPPKG